MIVVFTDAFGAAQSTPTEDWGCPMCIFANGFVETGFITCHSSANPTDTRKSHAGFNGTEARESQPEAEAGRGRQGRDDGRGECSA